MIEIKRSPYNHPDQEHGMHTNGPANVFVKRGKEQWYTVHPRMNEHAIRKTIESIGYAQFVTVFCVPLGVQPLSEDEKIEILRIAKTWGDNPKKVWRMIVETVGIDRRYLAVNYLEAALDQRQAEQADAPST